MHKNDLFLYLITVRIPQQNIGNPTFLTFNWAKKKNVCVCVCTYAHYFIPPKNGTQQTLHHSISYRTALVSCAPQKRTQIQKVYKYMYHTTCSFFLTTPYESYHPYSLQRHHNHPVVHPSYSRLSFEISMKRQLIEMATERY